MLMEKQIQRPKGNPCSISCNDHAPVKLVQKTRDVVNTCPNKGEILVSLVIIGNPRYCTFPHFALQMLPKLIAYQCKIQMSSYTELTLNMEIHAIYPFLVNHFITPNYIMSMATSQLALAIDLE